MIKKHLQGLLVHVSKVVNARASMQILAVLAMDMEAVSLQSHLDIQQVSTPRPPPRRSR